MTKLLPFLFIGLLTASCVDKIERPMATRSQKEFCEIFSRATEYSGMSAPNFIKIEYFEKDNVNYLLFVAADDKDVVSLKDGTAIDLYYSNSTKKRITKAELKKELLEGENGKTTIVYIYSPSTEESKNLKSGIKELVYVDPVDIYSYNFIGNCGNQ